MINLRAIEKECKKDLIDMISSHEEFETDIEKYKKICIKKYSSRLYFNKKENFDSKSFCYAMRDAAYDACLHINGDLKELSFGFLLPVDVKIEYTGETKTCFYYTLTATFLWSKGEIRKNKILIKILNDTYKRVERIERECDSYEKIS